MAANNEYQLVLMDIKMPLLNGIEATKIIKQRKPNLPIVIQSAYAMQTEREMAQLAGCDGYLTKPISKEDLMTMINKFAVHP
jgi:CheY-like chemotaxis protein